MATITRVASEKPASAICSGSAGRLKAAVNRLAVCLHGLDLSIGAGPWILAGVVQGSNERPRDGELIDAVGGCNALPSATEDGAKDLWWKITPYGRFPIKIMEKGVERAVTQVITPESADKMVSGMNSLSSLFFSLGLPVYEQGHPDDPAWRKANPGTFSDRKVARVKELQRRDDGLYGRIAVNSIGREVLDPQAPQFGFHSPNWAMRPINPQRTEYEPVLLRSLGLTDYPNLPPSETRVGLNAGEPNQPEINTMPPWLIDLLKPLLNGAEPTEENCKAALVRIIGTLPAAEETAQKLAKVEVTASNARAEADRLLTENKQLRGARAKDVIDACVASGRITEADRDARTSELVNAANEADWSAIVSRIQGAATGLNTAPFGGRSGSPAAASVPKSRQIRAAHDQLIQANPHLSYDQTFRMLRSVRPDLFQ